MIVYNFQKKSTFILQDKEIIIKHSKVLEFKFSPSRKLFTIFYFFYQGFYLIWHWRKYQLIISQIAGYHTFLPSILSSLNLKKHIIILHGTDCNVIPSIKYGNLLKPLLGWFTRSSIKQASLLLPVSESLIFQRNSFFSDTPIEMGLKSILPDLKTKFEVIYNGLNYNKFKIYNEVRPENTFITVGLNLEDEKNFKLKGIDLILDLARKCSQFKITIIGSEKIFSYNNDLENVTIIGQTKNSELEAYFNRHKYYFQLSMVESFGVALCEAMLCGCIPIVSDVEILKDIIEKSGYILYKKNISHLIDLLNKLEETDNSKLGIMARDLIINKYSLQNRENRILKVISYYLKTVTSP